MEDFIGQGKCKVWLNMASMCLLLNLVYLASNNDPASQDEGECQEEILA